MENIQNLTKPDNLNKPEKSEKPNKKDNKTGNSFVNKLFSFFSNKWTKFGFSFISLGYLWFLGWVTWLTFAYNFVYDNAAAVFLLFTFINVLFAIVMVYTRKCVITKLSALFMHPFILIMLVYGFGNWFLIMPPFMIAAVIFFASGANESLKIILGTVYMILFVLTFLAYVTLETLTINIPGKMDLHLREYPIVVPSGISSPVNGGNNEDAPFRIVAYVDPETMANRRANIHIERTDLDKSLWNITLERINTERAGTVNYNRDYELRWISHDTFSLDGRLIEIDSEGKMIVVSNETAPAVTTTAETGDVTAEPLTPPTN
jgi:hypothetical protein